LRVCGDIVKSRMNKLLSFVFLSLLVAVTIVLVMKAPKVSQIISCYDQNNMSFDQAEYGSRAQGWSQLELCKMKEGSIVTLEQCIGDITSNDKIPGNVYDIAIKFLPSVHPDIKAIAGLKTDHDTECADYPSTRFETP
jgi:hypothetical protein